MTDSTSGKYSKYWLVSVPFIQLAISVWLGLPGHMSLDSVIQLYEGRHLHFISFNPPLMSLLLGLFDKAIHAPTAFVLISAICLSTATAVVFWQSRCRSAIRLLLATLLVLNPVLMIYAGIVWKDVLLAHGIAMGFMLVELLPHKHGVVRWTVALLILLMITIIIGVRQQGILFAVPLAIWAACRLTAGVLPAMTTAIVLMGSALLINSSVAGFAQERSDLPPGGSVGLKILMRYDLTGMLANDAQPSSKLNAGVLQEMLPEVPKYSSYRVDTLDGPNTQFWTQSLEGTVADWTSQIVHTPLSYVKHRALVFARLLGIGDRKQCLPYHRGVTETAYNSYVEGNLVDALGLQPGAGSYSRQIFNLVTKLQNTPLFWHWFYLAAALGLILFFWSRRDWLPVTLLVGTAAYIGSYLLVGIACDFRYGYTLPVVVSLLGARALLGNRSVMKENQ